MKSYDELVNQQVITPFNFHHPTRYPCIICFQRCLEPISCLRCKQIICHKHLIKLKNKCPNCRLSPYHYQREEFLDKLTQNELNIEKDILITKGTFTCLVEGCSFTGKYHKMDIHRRRQHRQEQLKDILFPEEREKKNKRQLVEKLFLKILKRKQQQIQLSNKAKQLEEQCGGKTKWSHFYQMLWHCKQCQWGGCKKVYSLSEMAFVGNQEGSISQCPHAKFLMRIY